MPLHETVGPLARNEWLLVMLPFQLASGRLVRGCLVVPFYQLTAAWLVPSALVDIQHGAVCLGKGLKNSPLIHCGENHRQKMKRLKLLMVHSCGVCFVVALVPASCIIN
ncbi:hypothetical protein PVL29_003482 [Vitis rotundifolia]|uniref:Uncharacterized protein n=1 Tax=Vitis rotundifolia TaxID=103349 RepID=A0AA39AFJ6_VITRO|nr:hypothetical protein PVL29_003482 [Vitis rotundifolia]